MRVAITGAGGFIGSNLVSFLQAEGHEVLAVSRTKHNENGVGYLSLNVCDENSVEILACRFENCQAVVHTVGLAHDNSNIADGEKSQFEKVNVTSSINVARAAAAAEVELLVYISSVKVHGQSSTALDGEVKRALTDWDTLQPEGIYGTSKKKAEEAIIRTLAASKTKYVILRPPLVYGVGQKGNLKKLCEFFAKRRIMVWPKLKNQRSMIGVGNLCGAIAKIIASRNEESGAYLIADTNVSTSELISRIGQASHTRLIFIPMPKQLILFLASLIGKRDSAEKLFGSLVVDDSMFRRQFDWKPSESLEYVIEKMFKRGSDRA